MVYLSTESGWSLQLIKMLRASSGCLECILLDGGVLCDDVPGGLLDFTATQGFHIPSIPLYSQSCSCRWQAMFLCSLHLNLKVQVQLKTLKKMYADTNSRIKHKTYQTQLWSFKKSLLVIIDLYTDQRPSLPMAAYFLWLTGGTSLRHRSEAPHSFPRGQKTLMVLDKSAQEQDVTYSSCCLSSVLNPLLL